MSCSDLCISIGEIVSQYVLYNVTWGAPPLEPDLLGLGWFTELGHWEQTCPRPDLT